MLRFALISLCWLILAAPAWAGVVEGGAAYERGDYQFKVPTF